jgi:hypothetical protein
VTESHQASPEQPTEVPAHNGQEIELLPTAQQDLLQNPESQNSKLTKLFKAEKEFLNQRLNLKHGVHLNGNVPTP